MYIIMLLHKEYSKILFITNFYLRVLKAVNHEEYAELIELVSTRSSFFVVSIWFLIKFVSSNNDCWLQNLFIIESPDKESDFIWNKP